MKKVVILVSGLIGIIIGTMGWIRAVSLFYVVLQLVATIVFLESILSFAGIHSRWKKSKDYIKHLAALFILGMAVGAFFDFPGIFIFKIWEYPYHSPAQNLMYYFGIIPVWGLFFIIFHQSFLLLNRLLGQKHQHKTISKKIFRFFLYIGLIGLILVGVGAGFPKLYGSAIVSAFLFTIGAWFVLEGLEFPRKRPTLLYELINLNFRPLIAITIGGFLVGFLYEFSNIQAPLQYWVYHGVPLKNLHIFGIPVSLPIAWSAMYIIFLSIENMLLKKGEPVWD